MLVIEKELRMGLDNCIFRGVGGSQLYGVSDEDSDIDLRFIHVLPKEDFLGIHIPRDKKLTKEWVFYNHENGKKTECVSHEAGKFCRLLLKGNPSIVELLFSSSRSRSLVETIPHADMQSPKPNFILERHWLDLYDNRHRFISKETVRQYAGYISGQLSRLEKGQSVHTTGGQWNTKFAYHIYRLSMDLLDILEGRYPTISYDSGHIHDNLVKIRNGEIDKAIVIETAEEVLEYSHSDSENIVKLEERGQKEWLNTWLINLRNKEN